jgi:hypothetical protein
MNRVLPTTPDLNPDRVKVSKICSFHFSFCLEFVLLTIVCTYVACSKVSKL